MKRFVEAIDRSQAVMFPARLDDYVDEENPVRAVDVFVDALDLAALGFEAVNRAAGGRPAYQVDQEITARPGLGPSSLG